MVVKKFHGVHLLSLLLTIESFFSRLLDQTSSGSLTMCCSILIAEVAPLSHRINIVVIMSSHVINIIRMHRLELGLVRRFPQVRFHEFGRSGRCGEPLVLVRAVWLLIFDRVAPSEVRPVAVILCDPMIHDSQMLGHVHTVRGHVNDLIKDAIFVEAKEPLHDL